MSDEGDKTCPLCAEEMDPTDQQLKPCKCGYEICVWCWHHIMEMAEKDDTEGRCPACRTPYNKEKIVGMAAKCERLVSEMNMEKKPKSQKGKSKISEGRKQLGSVRVIQRNLVYVVGLPSHLAVEDILQRREYFGQYGKVLKVSISRPTNGAIQQFANSTCSVYITYSKEEEAVRCIQFVHGFLLDGKPLRACFGTTKYCHAWLRNVPCSNPDCLYLHEIGSQEDSFTKDEIISSYTWNRVQQITGSSYITQRHSGNVLPPPTDDNSINSSAFPGKPASKTAVNNHSFAGARVSPPNSSSGGSVAHLTAPSWGGRPSSNQPLLASTACITGPPLHQKPDMHDGQSPFPKEVLSASQASQLQNDTGKRVVPDEESSISLDRTTVENSLPVNTQPNTDGSISVSDISVAPVPLHHVSLSIQPLTPPTTIPPSDTPYTAPSSMSFSEPVSDKDFTDDSHGNIDNACSAILSMSIHENKKPQNGYVEQINPLICQASGKAVNIAEVHNPTGPSGFISGLPTQLSQVHLQQKEDDSFYFGNEWLEDPQVAINRVPDNSHTSNLSKYSSILSPRANNDGLFNTKLGRQGVDNSNLLASTSDFRSGHPENILDSREFDDAIYSKLSPSKEARPQLGSYVGKVDSTPDIGESSILSNILSMDFDPWNESAISPWSLFGETEKQQEFSGVRGSRKTQNSSQSRFAFAREDNPNVQVSYFGQSSDQYEDAFKDRPFVHKFSGSNNMQLEKFVHRSNLPVLRGIEPDTLTSSHSYNSSNKLSDPFGCLQIAPRSQIPAPPGFSVPSRLPPPGFSTLEKMEHIFESASGYHITDASSSLRNQYQGYSSGSIYSNGEVEFDDPAILAVGKGTLAHNVHSPGIDMRYSLPPQLNSYEDSRVQSVPQRSLPPHQSQKYIDMRDHFSSLGDAYGSHSRILEQNLSNNFSPFPQYSLPQPRTGTIANSPWNGWNEAQSASNVGVAELLRTERLGFNHFYSGYEDSTIQMPPSSGNLYNGAYGV